MNWRILLADAEVWVRLGIKEVLCELGDVTICAESSDGRDAIRQAYRMRPDIIIADPWLPGANGIVLTKRILEQNPVQKMLIFGLFDSNKTVRELLEAGIKGFVLKTDPAADLLHAVKALQRDQLYFTSSIQTAILNGYLSEDTLPVEGGACNCDSLSLRELEVLQLLSEGRPSKEIGDILGISFRTAATHRANLMRKLSLHSIAQVTLYAISHQHIWVPRLRSRAEIIQMQKPELEKTARAAA
jgi:DNA-binding NarL/FixJ family response regulator